jgi:hypothetical protein
MHQLKLNIVCSYKCTVAAFVSHKEVQDYSESLQNKNNNADVERARETAVSSRCNERKAPANFATTCPGEVALCTDRTWLQWTFVACTNIHRAETFWSSQLTLWSIVLLEKLVVAQPLKIFSAILWNPDVYYRAPMKVPLAPIVSHMNPTNTTFL